MICQIDVIHDRWMVNVVFWSNQWWQLAAYNQPTAAASAADEDENDGNYDYDQRRAVWKTGSVYRSRNRQRYSWLPVPVHRSRERAWLVIRNSRWCCIVQSGIAAVIMAYLIIATTTTVHRSCCFSFVPVFNCTKIVYNWPRKAKIKWQTQSRSYSTSFPVSSPGTKHWLFFSLLHNRINSDWWLSHALRV